MLGERADHGLLVDLGSGGGLPGLVLAVGRPGARWVLLDSSARSTRFLDEAAEQLGVAGRVSVVWGRAEEAAREDGLRAQASTVVARSFGPPALTAECASGFLAPGGRLVVSEPPASDGARWPEVGLATLGQRLVGVVRSQSGHHFAVIEQVVPVAERFPRRTGAPRRRPLF